MEVDVPRAQSSLAGVDDPNATPAWVSMGLYFPWSSRTLLYYHEIPDVHRSSKRARIAATSETILPEVSGCSREGEECAICLQDFGAEETLRAMPCSHAFHRHCISKWLCHSAACPLCRHQLPAKDEEEDEEDEDEEDQLPATPEEEDAIEWVDGAIGSN